MKRRIARRCAAFLLLFCLLGQAYAGTAQETGSFVVDENEEDIQPDPRRQAWAMMRLMSDEEKIYQLFFVSLEDVTGEERSTALKAKALERRPVGGILLFGQNIVSEDQLRKLTDDIRGQQGFFPVFIGVDEEGGTVSRVANKLGYPRAPSPMEIGAADDEAMARAAGEYIADYLTPMGINMVFGPSLDTVIDKENVGVQTYGDDPKLVSRMALAMAEGLKNKGVAACFTHFPGHGEKTGNTSANLSVRRTLEEMRALEWVPFRDAISAGADMLLVSHAVVRTVGDDMPASTSSVVINGLLRGELGYDGVVITDALRMSAVTSSYKKGQEAVASLKAGADMLLLPPDLDAAVQAIRRALDTGELTMARIEESVERILAVKIRMNWIQ